MATSKKQNVIAEKGKTFALVVFISTPLPKSGNCHLTERQVIRVKVPNRETVVTIHSVRFVVSDYSREKSNK